jgi:hypothetical protein
VKLILPSSGHLKNLLLLAAVAANYSLYNVMPLS